jgi:hypothetical protein
VSTQSLREHVALLREYMFAGGSSYPGPEPNKVFSLGMNYTGTADAQIFRDKDDAKRQEIERAKKRKRADFRRDLRKMSLWAQQKR